MNPDFIGVLGPKRDERTVMDKKMLNTFSCGCNKIEAYNMPMIEPRTGKDINMLKQFSHCSDTKNQDIPYSLTCPKIFGAKLGGCPQGNPEGFCNKNVSIPASLTCPKVFGAKLGGCPQGNPEGYRSNERYIPGYANITDDPYNTSGEVKFMTLR